MRKLTALIVLSLLLPSTAMADGYVTRFRAALEQHKKCHKEGNALATSNYAEYQKKFGNFRGLDKVCGDVFSAVLNPDKK